MKEKIRILLLLLVTLISGSAMAAPLEWNGTIAGDSWIKVSKTDDKSVSSYSSSNYSFTIDGVSTNTAIKMESTTQIVVTLEKKANITIGITSRNDANPKSISFDVNGSTYTVDMSDATTSTKNNHYKEYQINNVTDKSLTIARGKASEFGIYYVKVDYDTNEQPYTVTFNQNGATSLTETAANAGIILPGLKDENVAVPTFGWSRADNVTNDGTYRDGQFAEGYWTKAVPAGDVIHQTAIGLTPGGKYLISLSAAASHSDWELKECPTGNNLTKVFAGDQETFIPVVKRRSVAEGEENTVTFLATADSDGNLKYGIKNVAPSGNWYIIKVNSITKCDGTDGLLGWYDTNGNKVGDAGQTIYPEADMTLKAKYAYSQKSVIKGTTTELETVNGEAFDGETLPVKKYLTKEGILYNTLNNSGTYYGITLNQPGEYKKEYTAVSNFNDATIDGSENARVVFLAEAEDIQGFGRKTDNNVKARCSNLYGGEVRNYPAVITSLPNGKYRIFAGVRGNSTTTYKIYVNDEEKASEAGTGSPQEFGTDVVELNQKSSEIKAGLAAGSSVWDYFIIVKTGDAVVECPHTIYEGDVIGETDNSSAWWGAHSKQFEISKGNSRTFTFNSHNFTEASNTWERNWAVLVTNILGHNGDKAWGGSEIFRVSGSGSDWGGGTSYLKFYRGNEEIGIGGDAQFFQDMKEGSSENTINISYVGKRIYLQGKIRAHNGTVYTIHSTSVEIDKQLTEEKVQVVFAVAKNHLTDFAATDEQPAYQVVSIPGIKDENDNVLGDASAAQGTVAITDAEGINIPVLTYVAHGTSLTFTATAGPGYVFKNWANGQTDATRTITYDNQIVMYSYFMAAEGALTVAKPRDLLMEMNGASETLTAEAQWAGGGMPAGGATYTWQTTQNYETIWTMTGGENLTDPTFEYSQTGGWAGRWYYRVKVTCNGKTTYSDWAKLIVKGGVLDASLPVTVKFSPEDRDSLGYLRTNASKDLAKSLEGVKNPPYLKNGEFISITEKGAKAFVINTRKGGGSGYGDFEVYVDDNKIGKTIHVEQSTTMTTEVINILNFDPNATHTIKIVSTASGSDLTMHYIQFFSTDNAELKTTFAEVKMRQPQTIAIESFSPGAITMQPVSSEFFDAEYNAGLLTITPKKAGEDIIKFDIAAATGFNANTVDFNVTVRKQNITMTFTPDSYSWNKVEQPEKPAFVSPQLVIKDEDGNIVSDYEFSGLDIWTLDPDIITISNNTISVPDDAQGTGTATAEWSGDVNYNKPENAVYSVNIVQGVSFYTAENHTYGVGEKGYLKDEDQTTLVTFTYGGWMVDKDHKYYYSQADEDAGKAKVQDSWDKGKQEDAKLFPPVDPMFEYHASAKQNAKSETRGNFVTGDIFTLPVRGDYMAFEPTVNGTLSVYILQNGCLAAEAKEVSEKNDAAKLGEFSPRAVFVVDGEANNVADYTKFEIKTNQTINMKHYTDKDDNEGDGYYLVTDQNDPAYNDTLNVATWTSFKGQSARDQAAYAAAWNTGIGGTQQMVRLDNGGYSAIQKGMVKYTFYVAAGQTYYVFANVSKIGFVGCNFVKDEKNQPTSAEEHTLALSENKAYVPRTEPTVSTLTVPIFNTVTLDRSFSAGKWNTICLPFTMTEQEVVDNFGKGTELIVLDKVNVEGNKATIHFTYHEIQSIVAGFPYLIKPAQNCNEVSVSNKIINPDTKLTVFKDNGYTSKGIDGFCTANVSNEAGTTTNYSQWLKAGDIFLSGNTLYISKGKSYLKGYRAYIEAPAGAQVTSISFEYGHAWEEEDEEPTVIDILQMDPDAIATFGGVMPGVYNLNGQKMGDSTDGLPKGIYIVNGQKVTVE